LKCWYTNAGNLNKKKLDELRLLIASLPSDIIFITETHFKQETEQKYEIELEGYKCFRKDRPVIQGGGVCIYVRKQPYWDCDTIDFDTIATASTPTTAATTSTPTTVTNTDSTGTSPRNVEQVWCKLSISNKDQSSATILLGCIYRPPEIDKLRDKAINGIIEKSGEIIREETNEYSGIILAGDFNYNSDDMLW